MENPFQKFFQTVMQNLAPAARKNDVPPADASADELPSLYDVGPQVSRPGPVPDPKKRMSDLEFMEYLAAEVDRLNHVFREATQRDIDPHPAVVAVTEADEFEDLRRIEIIQVQPTKLLPTEDGVEDFDMD